MDKEIKTKETMKKKETLLGKNNNVRWGGIVIALGVGAVIAYSLVFRTGEVVDRGEYNHQTIAMAPVQATVHDGVIELPQDAVKSNELVSFSYGKGENEIPLLAYVTPSGKLVTAVSMCEPCRSTKFHIEGNTMVCNACSTKWDLETLQGIEGGCLKYPPDVLGNILEGRNILIKEKDVRNWKPRV
jgi:uncharacterized membrane protein